jgi:hypothetical protein
MGVHAFSEAFGLKVTNPRPTRLYYAARGHFCKLGTEYDVSSYWVTLRKREDTGR